MVIGFDASRAFVLEKTGTENYSYRLLKSLVSLDRINQYVVYTKKVSEVSKLSKVPKWDWPNNFKFVEIPLTRLWTQAGLAYRTWVDDLDLLFVPAHTLPVFRKPKLKTVVTIHDLGYEYLPQYHQFPQRFYLNWSTIYAVKNADRIIAVSKTTRDDLVKKLGCDPEKINIIYEGVEAEKYRKKAEHKKVIYVLKKYSISDDYILSVGTIQPRKNYLKLIKSFQLAVKEKHFKDLQLIIVGKKGWGWKEILQEPKKIGLDTKVKFLEYIPEDDLIILYQNALCLVQPSLFEGFGLPVLEAMAAGCPVVASKIPSLQEIIGKAGIFMDPHDINSIEKGIWEIISNQDLRIKLIKLGLERIKKFTWEKTAQKTREVFEELS